MRKHVAYYYQTLCGLRDILEQKPCAVTHIYLSSLHFGTDSRSGEKYLHLNDFHPDDARFDAVWQELRQASAQGITIMCMLGGAGGAYGALFESYSFYYSLLRQFLQNHPCVTGLDLDVEEEVRMSDVQRLILDLQRDTGSHFTLTMAPVCGALAYDEPGLGGFSYKDLYHSPAGKCIDWFNVQCYGDYTLGACRTMIDNGYPAEQLVLGMLAGTPSEFATSLSELRKIVRAYPKIAGADVWEYCNAPPTPAKPGNWAVKVGAVLNKSVPAICDNENADSPHFCDLL